MSETSPPRNPSSFTAPGSFEELLEALHHIVAQLEAGSLPLDETIEKFKEGSQLATACLRQVTEAELRITELAMEASSEQSSLRLPDE